MIETFITQLLATGRWEAAAVLLGLTYAALAVRRNRLCWVAGGTSSAILAWLFAERQLPMQAVLQTYYVGMAVYGFWNWSRADSARRAISTWPLRAHLLAWIAIALLSALSATWLAAETQAAWPLADSVVTWASILGTWLVARVKIENWLYWIATNAVLVYLSAAQGLAFVALLYVAFLTIAVVGYVTWLRALTAARATT